MTHPVQPSDIRALDPQTAALIEAEERRQREKIILIPSESLTPPAVREALGSAFTSIYAEGYPRAAMRGASTEALADLDLQLAAHRRYADWRFYKGTEMADLIESLAGRRAAECFATPDTPAERIYANVQPLSGAAANLAVYEAFVSPGDTVMGMDLTEGGHLTHGSQFNITGKRYRIISYAADRKTGKLDYEKIMELAKTHRPKMIIGGFTSFPWQADWTAFRRIADEVGAILLADIAHTAGMVIAGVYPNPVGIADVVTFTTHKTLCGPRGAVVLSTDPEIAARIDNAIFPGEQGGPHVNKFAAIAVALKIAQTTAFRDLQRRIVENAAHLAAALQKEGLTLAYGGTDTHLLLVDLRAIENTTGYTMMGEIAARILDLAGIVCNKNTIPGDHSAADAHGIRLGTPWVTQRGMGKPEMEILAGIIAKVLYAIRPFSYIGLTGALSRGKLPLEVLDASREAVRALVGRVDPEAKRPTPPPPPRGPWAILRVHDARARALLHEATPSDLLPLKAGEHAQTYLFDGDGALISEVVIAALGSDDHLVLCPQARRPAVLGWLSALSDGYVVFDEDDLLRKVQGPALVEEIPLNAVPDEFRGLLDLEPPRSDAESDIHALFERHPERFAPHKPYFIGQGLLDLSQPDPSRTAFTFEPQEGRLKKTPLHEAHVELGAKLVGFAGWEMPVWYSSALEEHRAVREAAGLFDLGHMGVFQIEGPHAAEFLNVVTANYASWLSKGESQYAHLLAPSGEVIDDIFVYRRAADRFLVVVNASNEEKDWAWLSGINDGDLLIDDTIPQRRPGPRVILRDLKKERGVIDIALQGPRSAEIFAKLLDKREQIAVSALKRTGFCEIDVHGHQLLVARTGYTGEEIGYEIYIGGADARWVWTTLLEAGQPFGLRACGLAARDSTRTEAGLPLYGHDLAGPLCVSPYEAGFGAYVKLHKPFFIGRRPCLSMAQDSTREIVRFEVTAPGARPVRADAVMSDRNGAVLGRVTSCVSLGERQVGLALVERLGLEPDTPVHLLNPGGRSDAKPTQALAAGDRIGVPVPGRIVPRFLKRSSLPQVGGE
jgi:glycine hydroxymethyltransferase